MMLIFLFICILYLSDYWKKYMYVCIIIDTVKERIKQNIKRCFHYEINVFNR